MRVRYWTRNGACAKEQLAAAVNKVGVAADAVSAGSRESVDPGLAGEQEKFMKSKLINDGPQKTYVLVLDKGDEAVSSIESFVRKNGSPPRN